MSRPSTTRSNALCTLASSPLPLPDFILGEGLETSKLRHEPEMVDPVSPHAISTRYYPVQSAMMFVLTAMDFAGAKLLTLLARL